VESEAEAMADWCAALPALRERARAEGVLDRLDRDGARIVGGQSARPALRKWRPQATDRDQRGWSDRATVGMPQLPGWEGAAGIGAGTYTCPRERCTRRATRDEAGHPPQCATFGTPMQPA
jgi:hypothetical protein